MAGPSQTVLMLHGAAGWWLEHGTQKVRAALGQLGLFTEAPPRVGRRLDTPPHPTPTTTSAHNSLTSLVFYQKDSFPFSSLNLDRKDLPDDDLAAHVPAEDLATYIPGEYDVFMAEQPTINNRDPISSLDPAFIIANPPHAYILAMYFKIIDLFAVHIGQGITGKWLQRLRAFTLCLSFCTAEGWQMSSDPIFLSVFESPAANIAFAAFVRCITLHKARVESSAGNQEWDRPLPTRKPYITMTCMHTTNLAF